MSSALPIGWFSPHPPVLIPQVGRGEEAKAEATKEAMQEAARRVAEAKPDVVVICGPHGPVFADAFTIEAPGRLEGDFASFGAKDEQVSVQVQAELTAHILRLADAKGLPLSGLTRQLKRRLRVPEQLDHGVTVPLWWLQQAMVGQLPPVVIINVAGLPLEEHYQLGGIVQQAITDGGWRAAVIGSGDLSHRLTSDAPAGYHPDAHRFDAAVTELFRTQNPGGLPSLEELSDCAGECGLRPLAFFLGVFDGLTGTGEVLSYQAPFGVGYLVGLRQVTGRSGKRQLPELQQARAERMLVRRRQESPLVRLARAAVESQVLRRTPPQLPELPADLPAQAGVFVSLKQHGQLRGCIGTTGPTQASLGAEVVQNAISAATADPRFPAVTAEELDSLSYSVDVLGQPEPIASQQELDPARYGVIVQAGQRQGLLLPDLPGVDSVAEQVSIARQKAGIRASEPVQLLRFTVTRYH